MLRDIFDYKGESRLKLLKLLLDILQNSFVFHSKTTVKVD